MKPTLIILLIVFFSINCSLELLGQNSDLYVNKINNLISSSDAYYDDRDQYQVIHTDGELIKNKKLLWFIRYTRVFGGFASNYLLKDSLLIRHTSGQREFQDRKRTRSTNTVTEFYFIDESICYYRQRKYHEEKGKPDSLFYEVKLYVHNDTIIDIYKSKNIKDDDLMILNSAMEQANKEVKYNDEFLLR